MKSLSAYRVEFQLFLIRLPAELHSHVVALDSNLICNSKRTKSQNAFYNVNKTLRVMQKSWFSRYLTGHRRHALRLSRSWEKHFCLSSWRSIASDENLWATIGKSVIAMSHNQENKQSSLLLMRTLLLIAASYLFSRGYKAARLSLVFFY